MHMRYPFLYPKSSNATQHDKHPPLPRCRRETVSTRHQGNPGRCLGGSAFCMSCKRNIEHTHTCNVHMLSASWHRGQLSLTEMFAARMYGESVESGHPHPRSVAPPVRKCETVELSRRQPGTRRVCGSSTPTPWTQTGQRLSGIRYSTVIPASRCPPTVASHTRTLAHAELLNLSHPPATNHTVQLRANAQ